MPHVSIVEVAARDGLQGEPEHVSTSVKIELIQRAINSGIRRLEVASFVHPERVPRMADAEAVIQGLSRRVHLHNTRNNGLAYAQAALDAGIASIDASVGGIGGCPFAPAATGNIPTEDLLYLLDRSGVNTGVSLESVIETSNWLWEQLGRELPAMLPKAGIFPMSH